MIKRVEQAAGSALVLRVRKVAPVDKPTSHRLYITA